MENITNFLTETDENGQNKIDISYYKNTINDLIIRYIEETQTNPYKPTINADKITNNNMLSICIYIYESLFKREKAYKTDAASNIPYTQYNITSLLNLYVDIVQSYGCIPSLYGFSRMVGIQEETIKKIVTTSSMEMLNLRREMLRNALSDDRMGRIVLANNDSSFGLEYEKKNTIERETVKQGLALNDLPKLE